MGLIVFLEYYSWEPGMRTTSDRLDISSEAKRDNLCHALGLSQSDVVKAGLAERDSSVSRLNPCGATLVDTGPLVAWFDCSDHEHRTCVAFFSSHSGALVSIGPVLTEVCHLVPPEGAPRFLEWIQPGGLLLQDLPPGVLAAVACKDGLEQRATLRHQAGSLRSG